MTVLASDDFNRADNADLGANWTVVTSEGSFEILGNQVEPASYGTDAAERYSGIAWPADQYAQCVLREVAGTGGLAIGIGVCLRASAVARTYYRVVVRGGAADNVNVAKMVGGGFTDIDSFSSTAFADGDVLRAEIEGTAIRIYRNGVQIDPGGITDADIATGDAGIAYSSSLTDGVLDNWEGGDFVEPVFRHDYSLFPKAILRPAVRTAY